MPDLLDLINLAIYIKLHQVDSEDSLKLTSVEIHHVNVHVYVYVKKSLKWLQLRRHDNVKASYDNPKMRNPSWKITF